jgi:antitoxin ParD1/3/4
LGNTLPKKLAKKEPWNLENTNNWYFRIKSNAMAKNTSVLLGDYFDNFISQQVRSGKYASASEVVRAALRIFEHEETKKSALAKALIKGEKSGMLKSFDKDSFLNKLHQKHVEKK